MVRSMATDRGLSAAVAWLAIFVGCGPAVRPPEPPPEPGPVARTERLAKPVKGGRQIVIGEMCPQGAAGRPAIVPLVMRGVTWNDTAADLANLIERGGVPRFAVFGVDGKVAGLFETLGLMDVGFNQSVASGSYVGASPCTADAGKGARTEDPKCGVATGGCGLAVGELGRADDPPPVPAYVVGGVCVSGDALAIDIDADGKTESFPLGGVLDGIRSPAEEWSAAPTAGATCTPAFQLYDIRLLPPPDGGKPADPAKHTVKLAVLGVVDVDNDGRREVILQLEFPTIRTIVVYTATGSPQRLELAGEGQPFQR